jgi:hypothetical protein
VLFNKMKISMYSRRDVDSSTARSAVQYAHVC